MLKFTDVFGAKPFDIRYERRVQMRYWKIRRKHGHSIPKDVVKQYRFTTNRRYFQIENWER